MLLVKQFRPAVRRSLTEIPAGLLDVDGRGCAHVRVAGAVRGDGVSGPAEIEFLGGYYASPGFTDEYVHLFWTRTEAEPEGDAEDGIEVIRVPFARMIESARAGRIRDAKTALALLLAAERPPPP